jgi:ABC-type phosphate transport system substrate-binding protein
VNTIKQIFLATLTGATLTLFAPHAMAELVVVVSSKSPLAALTENQVADIFLGRSSELPGGGDAVPIDQADDAANRQEFYRHVTGKSPAQLKTYWSKLIFTGRGQPPREVGDASAVKKAVAMSNSAIGYIDRSEVDQSVKPILTLR